MINCKLGNAEFLKSIRYDDTVRLAESIVVRDTIDIAIGAETGYIGQHMLALLIAHDVTCN